jgi:cytochrome c556
MNGAVFRAGFLIVCVPAFLVAALAAEPQRTPSIRALMQKQYRVTKAPFVLIKRELDSPAPDWEKVSELAREFVALGAMLDRNEPKWGEMESWKRFTALHMADAKAMEHAADEHDRAALLAVHRRIETACKACHDAHRTPRRE